MAQRGGWLAILLVIGLGSALWVGRGCGSDAASSAPAAAPTATPAAEPAPVPGAAPTPATAPDAPPASDEPKLGLPAVGDLPPIPDPRTTDPWLARMTARFEPTADLDPELSGKYRTAIAALAPELIQADRDRRNAAARKLGRYGVATAVHLPGILRELRAPAAARFEKALADANAAIRAKGLEPEQVQWEPDLAQLEGTVAVLARQLIDGSAAEQAEAARLLGEVPEAVYLFMPRAGKDILDEPSRDALLAAQRNIWATADLRRVFRWMAVRTEWVLLVDRELFADPPEEMRDRDYVVPDLVLNNTAGELLCDFMTVPDGDGEVVAMWRTIRRVPVERPKDDPQPKDPQNDRKPVRIEIEFSATGPLSMAIQILHIKCRGVRITVADDVDQTRAVELFIRALDAAEALAQFAEQAGLKLSGDAESGYTLSNR